MLYRLSTRFRTDATGKRLPDVVKPVIEAAARHYRARDLVESARACDAILLLQPKHFDALHLRGVLHMEAMQAEEALDFLHRAAQQRPDEPQLHFHIGSALLALK